jgi:hypothetical protein
MLRSMAEFGLWAFILLLIMLPVFSCIWLINRQRKVRNERSKHPFAELRRPAGEWLRLKIEELDGQLLESVLQLVLGPAFLMMLTIGLRTKAQSAVVFAATAFLFSIVWSISAGRKIIKLVEDLANCRLGWDGERYVAEALNPLLAHGFEVYHDIQLDGYNIDHAVVGPTGVFAIETKTRRKAINERGEKTWTVIFDGTGLDWGRGFSDSNPIDQAREGANSFSDWLSSAVGDRVHVKPVLTIPGWDVRRLKPSIGVMILNPNEGIVDQIRKGPIALDEQMIRRIRHQLNAKCKIKPT